MITAHLSIGTKSDYEDRLRLHRSVDPNDFKCDRPLILLLSLSLSLTDVYPLSPIIIIIFAGPDRQQPTTLCSSTCSPQWTSGEREEEDESADAKEEADLEEDVGVHPPHADDDQLHGGAGQM